MQSPRLVTGTELNPTKSGDKCSYIFLAGAVLWHACYSSESILKQSVHSEEPEAPESARDLDGYNLNSESRLPDSEWAGPGTGPRRHCRRVRIIMIASGKAGARSAGAPATGPPLARRRHR